MEGLTPSVQDYLKTLRRLSGDGKPVRSADVADALGVARSSVSRAMGVLRQAGFIAMKRYGTITLTPSGSQTADAVKRSNELIQVFLKDVLGVSPHVAAKDACRMEHTVSAETAGKLERYLKESLKAQG